MTIKTIGYIQLTSERADTPDDTRGDRRHRLMQGANDLLEILQHQAKETHTEVTPFGGQSETTGTGAVIFTVYVRGDLPDLQDRIDALVDRYEKINIH